MKLLRVQVPEFRALKDVDISFEPEFYPQVFPLGSLNGGGKSTLLQLIFVLLHCSADKEKHQFIANLLEDVTIPEGETSQLFARFELQEGQERFELEFTICNDDYLRLLNINPIFNKDMVSFKIFINNQEEQSKFTPSLSAKEIELKKRRLKFLEARLDEEYDTETIKNEVIPSRISMATEIRIASNYLTKVEFDNLKNEILKNFEINNQLYITSLEGKVSLGLICSFKNLDFINFENCLFLIQEKIFISAPSNQSYLFLTTEERRLLFTTNPEKTYDQVLKGLRDTLPNFFTYDFADVLTEICRLERDKDFDEKLRTGIYGTNYEKLENAINSLFMDGKKIVPLTINQKRHTKDAIQSMGFKLASGVEIYPEDLSHGELKRLAIFVLLKYHDMKDSIILMDEIENGFHPDWQYQIVRDLIEWGKGNQYILATHSYELCTAVTPAHVKELEPKLIKE